MLPKILLVILLSPSVFPAGAMEEKSDSIEESIHLAPYHSPMVREVANTFFADDIKNKRLQFMVTSPKINQDIKEIVYQAFITSLEKAFDRVDPSHLSVIYQYTQNPVFQDFIKTLEVKHDGILKALQANLKKTDISPVLPSTVTFLFISKNLKSFSSLFDVIEPQVSMEIFKDVVSSKAIKDLIDFAVDDEQEKGNIDPIKDLYPHLSPESLRGILATFRDDFVKRHGAMLNERYDSFLYEATSYMALNFGSQLWNGDLSLNPWMHGYAQSKLYDEFPEIFTARYFNPNQAANVVLNAAIFYYETLITEKPEGFVQFEDFQTHHASHLSLIQSIANMFFLEEQKNIKNEISEIIESEFYATVSSDTTENDSSTVTSSKEESEAQPTWWSEAIRYVFGASEESSHETTSGSSFESDADEISWIDHSRENEGDQSDSYAEEEESSDSSTPTSPRVLLECEPSTSVKEKP